MEGRLEHGYRARFRALARRRGAADPTATADRLIDEARARAPHGEAHARALHAIFWREAGALRQRGAADGARAPVAEGGPPRFLCGPSLAGLARWLRAAGFEADYFLCVACGGLFWQGTHWERIREALAEAVGR